MGFYFTLRSQPLIKTIHARTMDVCVFGVSFTNKIHELFNSFHICRCELFPINPSSIHRRCVWRQRTVKRTQRATRDHHEEGNLAARYGAGSPGGGPWRRFVSGDLCSVAAQCDTAFNELLLGTFHLLSTWVLSCLPISAKDTSGSVHDAEQRCSSDEVQRGIPGARTDP